jgi:hypothetical protein
MNFKLFACAAVAVASVAVAGQAAAQQATITNAGGSVVVGLSSYGALYSSADDVGFRRTADGYDPIRPGVPRDSWGLSAGGSVAWSDPNLYGDSGIASGGLVAGANSAVATAMTDFGFTVVQNFSFVDGILRIDTSVTNNTADAVSDVLFQRDVDWDIAPAASNDMVFGPSGASSLVVDSSYYGFEDPNPSSPFGFSCFLGCNAGPDDLGGGIKINLGNLLGGATRKFTYFYGVSAVGQTPANLIAAGHAAGAQYIIAGRGSGDRPNSAFIGVAAVPEPATWAMLILGFFGLGAVLRRRRAVAA